MLERRTGTLEESVRPGYVRGSNAVGTRVSEAKMSVNESEKRICAGGRVMNAGKSRWL